MYYRVAWKRTPEEASMWTWKSTVLSSRRAVCGFLMLFHGAIAPGRFRIFTSAARNDLNEQLMRENAGLSSSSVTLADFLGYPLREPSHPATARVAEECAATAPSRSSGLLSRSVAAGGATGSPFGMGITLSDQRRLEIEAGPGGDADMPFIFIPPDTPLQRLAWVHLLTRVQRGELVP